MIRVHFFKHLLPLLLVATAVSACSKEESKIKVEDFHRPGQQPAKDGKSDEQEKPKVKASLPSAPPASAFVIPEKNADGSLRIRGLIHNQDKYLAKDNDPNPPDLQIMGIISFISPQCDPKKAKDEGRTCLKPNLFIKDDVDSPKSLQVVGFPFDFVRRAKLEPGQKHIFTGKYLNKSNGFINSGDGLIELVAVDDTYVDPRAHK